MGGGEGFNNHPQQQQQETKYSAQQGFQGVQPSHTPPASSYHSGADFLNRYKLEQTIRQLHGIHSADPRSSFGTSFSGV